MPKIDICTCTRGERPEKSPRGTRDAGTPTHLARQWALEPEPTFAAHRSNLAGLCLTARSLATDATACSSLERQARGRRQLASCWAAG